MVSGELEFLDGDHTFIARPGDFVHVPRGIRHRFNNKGLHAAKMIFLFTPGGPEQTFLDAFPKAIPGRTPEPLTEEQLKHMEQVSHLSNTLFLPDL
jgi:oxalate decarboxylase/phosphoglucose isomerase-like protein (cupin superfamily)